VRVFDLSPQLPAKARADSLHAACYRDNAVTDLAVGLDYTLWASDLTGVGSGLTDIVQIPEDIVIALLYLPLLPFVLAGA